MKKLPFLFIILLLMAVGCYKAPDCGSHGDNYKEICVCESGWGGDKCEIACLAGWKGANCDIPTAQSFAGNYHMTGVYSFYLNGQGGYIDTLDLILRVTEIDSTTLTCSLDSLTPFPYIVVPDYYKFAWSNGGNNYGELRFPKSAVDSLYYSARSGGLGGGGTYTLSGIKIQ